MIVYRQLEPLPAQDKFPLHSIRAVHSTGSPKISGWFVDFWCLGPFCIGAIAPFSRSVPQLAGILLIAILKYLPSIFCPLCHRARSFRVCRRRRNLPYMWPYMGPVLYRGRDRGEGFLWGPKKSLIFLSRLQGYKTSWYALPSRPPFTLLQYWTKKKRDGCWTSVVVC